MTVTGKTPILQLQNIGKSFGGVPVLRDVNLEVFAGEVVALLGENGAGKSTLSNIISGAITQSKGQMAWLGLDYKPTCPKEAIDLGVGMIHQELMLLPHLSVAENIFLARYIKRRGFVDHVAMDRAAQDMMEKLGLNIDANRLVAGLSTANQQLIEIIKALTLNAKLLILDEPTAALGGDETELLFNQIRRLKEQGVGIIYISHRLEEIKRIADRVVVMRDGLKVTEFDSAEVPVRTIVEAMVGRKMEQIFPVMQKPQDVEVLKVQNLTSALGHFYDINFSVRRGEIFGIAGLVGAGRTELVRAMAGVDPIKSGAIELNGLEVTPETPRKAMERGIVLVPEDRKQQGVILGHTIEQNFSYTNFEFVSSTGWINYKKMTEFADDNIQKFGVKGQAKQRADEMSGGNQQKIVIAKWLARNPKVVLLDEPTRGIDVGARSSIYLIIQALAKSGIAVVVVSSDLEEVLGISNRVLVMAEGKCTGILNDDEADTVSVMELATI